MNNHKEKRVMVIPGATAQIPLINALQKNGYSVVCVNPYEDSPAFGYADFSERYDILDVEACTKVAEKYNVCAVMSDQCDIAMPPLAAVSGKLGLHSIGSEMARLYTDKYAMREFSGKNGFPCPKYSQCKTIKEAKEFFNSLDTPKMIIKPLDSNSSRGVFTVSNPEELNGLFEQSLAFSKINKAVICEEYIEGTEFTVDGLIWRGKHYSLAISEKKHYAHHPNIACELYFSHSNSKFDFDRLREQNDMYVEKSGLPFGFTHAEYKFNGREFVLIEIGARGGGNYISSHIVPAMTGIDNYKLLIDSTMEKDDYDCDLTIKYEFKDRCSVLKFFDIDTKDDGKVLKQILGENLMKDNPKVLLYGFNVQRGERVKVADNDSKRIGFYIAYGDTKAELDEFIKTVDENIAFVF